MHIGVLSCFSHVRLFVTLWTIARQAPLSMGFSRQEYQSELPCFPPGDLPDPGFKPGSPALQADSLPSESPNYHTVAFILHTSKIMFKILHARLQLACEMITSHTRLQLICEMRTSRCSSWIQKRQRNQRSNCQHPLDHRKSKRVPGKHLLY